MSERATYLQAMLIVLNIILPIDCTIEGKIKIIIIIFCKDCGFPSTGRAVTGSKQCTKGKGKMASLPLW